MSLTIQQKLLNFDWYVLLHPLYSRDLAPSDYILLRSLQNSLNEKTFCYKKVMKTHLEKFFTNKSQIFYESRIMELVESWQKVIDNNSQYIIGVEIIMFFNLKNWMNLFVNPILTVPAWYTDNKCLIMLIMVT